MEQLFAQFASSVALALEALSVLIITWGAARALFVLVSGRSPRAGHPNTRTRAMFLTLGRHLLLGLEFTLAADVVRTAIAPTWDDIGKLGAIAVIRTFLNYFLERDIEHARAEAQSGAAAPSA